jgi:hypothetical protein
VNGAIAICPLAGAISAPEPLNELQRRRCADGGAVDVVVHLPLIRVGGLHEVGRLHVAHAERVVHRRAAAGVVVGVGVGRIERRDGRRGRVARQRHLHVDVAGGLRRAGGGQQLQVDQAAHVETVAVGVGREHLQALAVGRADEAVGIGLEVARTRVHARAVVVEHEEAFAVDRDVQAAAGRIDVALRELLRDVAQLHARTDRVARQAVSGRREQVGEFGARFLEAGRVDVGDVVRRDVEVGVGGVDAGQRSVETHDRVLRREEAPVARAEEGLG